MSTTKHIDDLHLVAFRVPYGHYRDLKDEVKSLRLENDRIRQEQVLGAALMAFQSLRESEKVRWVNTYRLELYK